MPELPEVEIARRNLVQWLDGRRVVRAEADDSRIFRGARREDFALLKGRLLSLERRGKYLLFTFEGGRGLLGHLGMTGRFVRRPEGAAVPYSRARFHLDSGDVIHFADSRLFGRMEPCAASRLHARASTHAASSTSVDCQRWVRRNASISCDPCASCLSGSSRRP